MLGGCPWRHPWRRSLLQRTSTLPGQPGNLCEVMSTTMGPEGSSHPQPALPASSPSDSQSTVENSPPTCSSDVLATSPPVEPSGSTKTVDNASAEATPTVSGSPKIVDSASAEATPTVSGSPKVDTASADDAEAVAPPSASGSPKTLATAPAEFAEAAAVPSATMDDTRSRSRDESTNSEDEYSFDCASDHEADKGRKLLARNIVGEEVNLEDDDDDERQWQMESESYDKEDREPWRIQGGLDFSQRLGSEGRRGTPLPARSHSHSQSLQDPPEPAGEASPIDYSSTRSRTPKDESPSGDGQSPHDLMAASAGAMNPLPSVGFHPSHGLFLPYLGAPNPGFFMNPAFRPQAFPGLRLHQSYPTMPGRGASGRPTKTARRRAPSATQSVAPDSHLPPQESPARASGDAQGHNNNLDPAAENQAQSTAEKGFLCHVCNTIIVTTKQGYKDHLKTHYDYPCQKCAYNSKTKGRLESHMNKYHNAGGDKPTPKSNKPKRHKCKQCGILFESKEDFWLHQREVHIKPEKLLTCDMCPFVTEYKHHLEYHMRNHLNSKPYKCNECEYVCVNKSMLNSHMKSHSNVHQYRCRNCLYSTKYSHSLKTHCEVNKHFAAVTLNPDGSLPEGVDIELAGLAGPKKRRAPRGSRSGKKGRSNDDGLDFSSQLSPGALLGGPSMPPSMVEYYNIPYIPSPMPPPLMMAGLPHSGPLSTLSSPAAAAGTSLRVPFGPGDDSRGFECPHCDFRAICMEQLFSHMNQAHRDAPAPGDMDLNKRDKAAGRPSDKDEWRSPLASNPPVFPPQHPADHLSRDPRVPTSSALPWLQLVHGGDEDTNTLKRMEELFGEGSYAPREDSPLDLTKPKKPAAAPMQMGVHPQAPMVSMGYPFHLYSRYAALSFPIENERAPAQAPAPHPFHPGPPATVTSGALELASLEGNVDSSLSWSNSTQGPSPPASGGAAGPSRGVTERRHRRKANPTRVVMPSETVPSETSPRSFSAVDNWAAKKLKEKGKEKQLLPPSAIKKEKVDEEEEAETPRAPMRDEDVEMQDVEMRDVEMRDMSRQRAPGMMASMQNHPRRGTQAQPFTVPSWPSTSQRSPTFPPFGSTPMPLPMRPPSTSSSSRATPQSQASSASPGSSDAGLHRNMAAQVALQRSQEIRDKIFREAAAERFAASMSSPQTSQQVSPPQGSLPLTPSVPRQPSMPFSQALAPVFNQFRPGSYDPLSRTTQAQSLSLRNGLDMPRPPMNGPRSSVVPLPHLSPSPATSGFSPSQQHPFDCSDLYECRYCRVQFPRKSMFDHHMSYHSPGDPFKCKCGKVCSGPDSFYQHMTTVAHPGE